MFVRYLSFSSFTLLSLLLATSKPCLSFGPQHVAFNRVSGPYSVALFSTKLEDVATMRASAIKQELESYGISTKSFLEKSELVDALKKARAEGRVAIPKSSSSTTGGKTTSSESSSTDSKRPRDERLKEEKEKCKAMKASELKKELEERGVSTKSFFEKSEFVNALAEARVDGVTKKDSSNDEGYAEYKDVEVVTDDRQGPRAKGSSEKQRQQSPFGGGGSPFGGAASPFGDMGGMGGMADMLKNMGMGGFGGGGGGSPFGGANPFGGMGDAMGKAQQMMSNPEVREIVAEAQKNPKIMAAVTECMSNPAAMAKYQNDPEVMKFINKLQKFM